MMTSHLGRTIKAGYCPACDSIEGFLKGPEAGRCVNIQCKACGNRYNFSEGQKLSLAEYIGRDPEAKP